MQQLLQNFMLDGGHQGWKVYFGSTNYVGEASTSADLGGDHANIKCFMDSLVV